METVSDDLRDHAVVANERKTQIKFLEEINCQILYHSYARYAIDVRFRQPTRSSRFHNDVKYWYS